MMGPPKIQKTADLLHKAWVAGDFLCAGEQSRTAGACAEEIREVAKRFEVGSHTMSHLPINRMSNAQASREIKEGKTWLEDVLGERVISFCYPRGKFNRTTPTLVREAGFLGARTTMMNLYDFPENPFLWGVSTQAYSHSRMIQVRHALLETKFRGDSQLLPRVPWCHQLAGTFRVRAGPCRTAWRNRASDSA